MLLFIQKNLSSNMPILEVFSKFKCFLSTNHLVHEPILLSCDSNACRKCIENSISEVLKCKSCKEEHNRNEYLNVDANNLVENLLN